jgi:hypothetical protein
MEITLLWSMPFGCSGITHMMQLEKVDLIYAYLKAQQGTMTQNACAFYIFPMCMHVL